jgi:nucleotide-binding universal stress UspA family protein
MYRTIMVPLDGSPFGECALPLAVSLARRAGATLQLVQVMPPLGSIYTETPLFIDSSFEQEVREHERASHLAYLDRTFKMLSKVTPLQIQTVLLEGDIPHQLRQQAARSRVDLVVMTTHARGPLGRFWLGSVADELVRHLPMPVLLVRPGERCTVFDPEPVLQNILIPLDGHALAEQMIEPALTLGGLVGASYTLLEVIKPVLPVVYPLEGAGMAQAAQALIERTEALQAQLRRDAQDYLDRVATNLRQRGYRVLTRVEVEEKPALAILNQAQSDDLVAMSTHGRHGLGRLIAGSVADKVIRGSHLPVLAYHPAEVARHVEWTASELAVASSEE